MRRPGDGNEAHPLLFYPLYLRRQHGDIWKVAQTPEEAVQLLYETPVWDISIRKFAAI